MPDTVDVSLVLAFLLEERRNWLHGESAHPIERLTMLANERSVALVTPDAELDLAVPPRSGRARGVRRPARRPRRRPLLHPAAHNGLPLGQRYLPNTMTVETRSYGCWSPTTSSPGPNRTGRTSSG